MPLRLGRCVNSLSRTAVQVRASCEWQPCLRVPTYGVVGEPGLARCDDQSAGTDQCVQGVQEVVRREPGDLLEYLEAHPLTGHRGGPQEQVVVHARSLTGTS